MYGDDGGDNRDVQDLVEPVTRPRLWQFARRFAQFYRYPGDRCFVEWQLPGSDVVEPDRSRRRNGYDDGSDEEDGSDEKDDDIDPGNPVLAALVPETTDNCRDPRAMA
jgi:hypothetical protein